MISLTYDASGFPGHFGPQLRGQHRLQFNWPDLLRAAIRVGRPSWTHVYQHGVFSRHEASYRRYLIRANLRQSPTGELQRSDVYEWLDPSEKSGVSYFLGLIAAGLLSELLLGKYWLVHLDVYRHLLPPVIVASRRRPDLISLDSSSQFVVFECKGRTNSPEAGLTADAKLQASAVTSIGGHIPGARIASIAHFKGGNLSLIWHDPRQGKEEAFDIPIEREQVIRDHYEPLLNFISSSSRVDSVIRDGVEYTIAAIPETTDFVGLATELIGSKNISATAEHLTRSIAATSNESESIGLDGSFVQLGQEWSLHQMILEPGKRSA